jgi:predicted RNA-binding protein YlxR (DUF448 family)
MTESVRTCIGCRRRGPAAEMIRLRIEGGRVAIGHGPGRGASLHPRATCVAGAQRPGTAARAFKRPVDELGLFDPTEFFERLSTAAAGKGLATARTGQS